MDLLTHQFGSTAFRSTARGSVLFEAKSWIGRVLFGRTRVASHPYINIGCGPNILSGFENIDFYSFGIRARRPRGVVGHDLRYPLPYSDESFAGAYSEHCLEHLHPHDALQLAREVRRVLRPGAVFRCAVPDLERYIRYYVGKSPDPEFSKFRSGCEAIWSLTQNWGHLSVWDASMLIDALRGAGFSQAAAASYRIGRNPDLLVDLSARRWETLYVEAIR